MKIAYVIPYLQEPGGWRTHACAFLQAIRAYVEPQLFVARSELQTAQSLFDGMPVHALPVTQQASLSSWHGRRNLLSAWWAIQSRQFPAVDLVHSLEAYPTGLVGSWLAGKLGCPHVITTHGTYGVVWHDFPFDRRVYEHVLRGAALVCPISLGTAGLMRQYFQAALTHTAVLPILNGNDFYHTVPRHTAIERTQPLQPTLLTVGDIKPRKGQHISLAAFARVKAAMPDARYWIVGNYQPNAYYQQLQQFIAEQHLEDVHFLGRVPDSELQRLYRLASLFVLTPQQEGLHFEGFGLVYLEAGAYGLPVVATRTGGVADAVQDGVTGFLAEQEDVDGLAQAILRLLRQPELARRMGQANRQQAERLTWERNANLHLQAYERLLEGRS